MPAAEIRVLSGGAWKRKSRTDRTPGVSTVPSSSFAPGSVPVGTAAYVVPAGAVYASPSGNDTTGTGTAAAPYLTLKKALSVAPANGTVVLRAGEYHEGGVYPSLGGGPVFAASGVTVQNYPNEAVWLDGSVPLTGWTQSGAVWRAPFVQTLDRGKSQTRGEAVSSYGSFVVSEFPLASWPEMLLVNGVQLTQVDSLGAVTAGTFYVEGAYPNSTGTNINAYTSSAYVIGVNPAGADIRVGTLARAIGVGQTNATVRGIGIRRYVPSLPDFGAIFVGNTSAAGFAMENVVIEDVSTLGIAMNAVNGHLDRITVQRCGQEGVGGSNCDNAILENSLLKNNVNRRFNYGPDAGGLKWTRAWDVIVRFNEFDTNYGHDCWLDESVYRGKVHGNYFHGSYGKGVAYEIGDSGLIVDNIFVDQGVASTDIATRKPQDSNPIWISGSNRCRIWHNTVINTEQGVKIAQDSRRPLAAGSFGKDPRQPDSFYQTEMTWDITSVEFKNNALVTMAGTDQVQSTFYTFYDVDSIKSTTSFGPSLAGNLYTKPDSTHPNRFANGRKGSTVVVYFDLTGVPVNDTVTWTALLGDAGSKLVANVVGYTDRAHGQLSATYLSQVTPATVPSDVAALLATSPFAAQRVGAGYIQG